MSKRPYPHVAVCVDKSGGYGRGVLRGIADYVEVHGPWSLYIDPQSSGIYGEDWLGEWRGDGILAYVESPSLAQRIAAKRIPTVELFGHRSDLALPQVGNDDEAIGRMAAEHLLERRFQRFAFSGYPGEPWSQRRFEGFAQLVQARNFPCEFLSCARHPATLDQWEQSQQELIQWLDRLAKPCGLMACSDRHAQRILDACRRAAIHVPEEIAVIGVDNDEETCRLSNPPLTSVMDNPRQIGLLAAQMLDDLMHQKKSVRPSPALLVPPLGVITRRSTEVTAVEDPLVARAMRHIRDHASNSLTTNDLLVEFHVTRSVLYRSFQKSLGRPPHEEILRARVDRVKLLLHQTQLTLPQIAEMTGFDHPEYLSVVFKRETGLTPGQFSKQSAIR
jgi:LacI family transcriptional regulator